MKPSHVSLSVLCVVLVISGCATGGAKRGKKGYTESGKASWYGPDFHGRATANGEIYDMDEMTAAHRHRPFVSIVEVRNRDNGRRVRVRINDRGPFVSGRIIDLSRAAAAEIAMIGPGTARVEIRVVVPASSADSRYWIQAGAFREEELAEELRRELRSGFPTVRVTHDGTWYRVQIGPYSKAKRADRAKKDLQRRGIDAVVKRTS